MGRSCSLQVPRTVSPPQAQAPRSWGSLTWVSAAMHAAIAEATDFRPRNCSPYLTSFTAICFAAEELYPQFVAFCCSLLLPQ